MGIPFLDRWRERHGPSLGFAVMRGGQPIRSEDLDRLLSECELLRELAESAGVRLDESAASLEQLDQLLPRWREDPDTSDWLGNDAGLYLGSVIVHRIPGASWELWPNGHPVIRLSNGRELDVVALGHAWASEGAPELSSTYAEADEG